MDWRQFLEGSTALAITPRCFSSGLIALSPVLAETTPAQLYNPNLADPSWGAKASASSSVNDPPWGYGPENVFGEVPFHGWQADKQMAGAWIEITFPDSRQVSELWILAQPLPEDVLGQDVYLMTHSHLANLAAPRRIRIELSDGVGYSFLLSQARHFQILSLPEVRETSSIRIIVEDVWPTADATDVGLGKVRVFGGNHPFGFDVFPHSMYSARNGKPIQAVSLRIINPMDAILNATISISNHGETLANVPLQPTPAHAVFDHEIWMPAPFEDSELEFAFSSPSSRAQTRRSLVVPKYHSFFDGGTFEFNCTNHNDLGWLDTQAKTADYRSSALILPALELMQKYPEFKYTMECTAYLMEFLERHPEMKDAMVSMMHAKRFVWGASYVELLQVSAGPERLVRQFYLGRRWLKKTFPGVDTTLYMQTDPPSMGLQMAQILAKAGVKYCLLGRLPFGFYNWESPDGSHVLTYGYRYVDPLTLIDFKTNSGWLNAATEREDYYASNHLPHNFLYDYTSDYLPPQADLVPYVRQQNRDMEDFQAAWNAHFSDQPTRQIHPPKLGITTPDKYLGDMAEQANDITTLRGEWPLSWAYYDEPSNREALLAGRIAHNELLAAERLYTLLGLKIGFHEYPSPEFENAWRANLWPDHGWGGNHGVTTDHVYADSYLKSRMLADRLIAHGGETIASRVDVDSSSQIPVVVYNQLSWPRTDLVEFSFDLPSEWESWKVVDDSGNEVPSEQPGPDRETDKQRVAFIANDIPGVGYRTYFLRDAKEQIWNDQRPEGHTIENKFFRVELGKAGIKSMFDKRANWEVLRTDKFEGAEVVQFAAPGNAWEDTEKVTMEHFDRTANHEFRLVSLVKSPIRTAAVYEATFDDFTLREHFYVYDELDRLDVEVEILDWKGNTERELRVVFPINLDQSRLSYEVPFGTVEIGKDELDFSLLPPAIDSQFQPAIYGGTQALTFREAINWIDASSPHFNSNGCLLASDVTVHLFQDESDRPVAYPMLQHVLLSVRKSLSWNPEYWCTQQGNHRYRMTILPHSGDWRVRYREAIGFNFRLAAFTGKFGSSRLAKTLPANYSCLVLEPDNLILTAMKKCEDDDSIIVRFYEAEGNKSVAHIRLAHPVVSACKTNLIEEDEQEIRPRADGSIELPVGACEIVTLRLKV